MARRERLTKGAVEALKPARKDRMIWDADVPRLAIRVRPGGGRHYVVRLRVEGRQRWLTIGAHGDPWTPDTARDEARRLLGLAANVEALRLTGQAPAGLRHPVEAREDARVAPTLATFAERYLAEHAVPHKKASSAAADAANLKRAILPALGKLEVRAIVRADVVRFHLARKATPVNANRCLALLSHMLSMAERWGVRPEGSNPCRHVDRFRETRRERFLDAAELRRLGDALTAADKADSLTPFGLAAIRLLIFTGARASEILGLKWVDVRKGASTVRLPDSKTGAKNITLNPPAAAVLAGLVRVAGNPHVIAGRLEGKPLTLAGLEQCWQEVRNASKLEDVRLHDLRHSFASVAVSGGASLPLIGGLLGHKTPSTTARYAHLTASPLQAVADKAGAAIADAMGEKTAPTDKVVKLRRGRR